MVVRLQNSSRAREREGGTDFSGQHLGGIVDGFCMDASVFWRALQSVRWGVSTVLLTCDGDRHRNVSWMTWVKLYLMPAAVVPRPSLRHAVGDSVRLHSFALLNFLEMTHTNFGSYALSRQRPRNVVCLLAAMKRPRRRCGIGALRASIRATVGSRIRLARRER